MSIPTDHTTMEVIAEQLYSVSPVQLDPSTARDIAEARAARSLDMYRAECNVALVRRGLYCPNPTERRTRG